MENRRPVGIVRKSIPLFVECTFFLVLVSPRCSEELTNSAFRELNWLLAADADGDAVGDGD